MKLFCCSICGEQKDESEKATLRANYCRTCWNHYQKTRRRVTEAGRVFTMATYRKARKKAGLSTVDVSDVRRGRPRLAEVGEFRCEVCDTTLPTTDISGEDERMCRKCSREFLKHQAYVKELTAEWYLALRKNPDILDRFVPSSLKEPMAYHRMKGQHDTVRRLIAQYGTVSNVPTATPSDTTNKTTTDTTEEEATNETPCTYEPGVLCSHRHCKRVLAEGHQHTP